MRSAAGQFPSPGLKGHVGGSELPFPEAPQAVAPPARVAGPGSPVRLRPAPGARCQELPRGQSLLKRRQI